MNTVIEIVNNFLVRKRFIARWVHNMAIRCTIDCRCVGMWNFIDPGMTTLARDLAMVGRLKEIVIDIKKPFALFCVFTPCFFNPAKPRILVAHGTTAFDFSQTNRGSKQQWNEDTKSHKEVSSLQINYGIENYFVPEGEGLKLERPKAGDKVTLEIALDGEGHAAIKSLLLIVVEVK